jgi:hypothetical protein
MTPEGWPKEFIGIFQEKHIRISAYAVDFV